MASTDVFTIGRVVLANGTNNTPFPGALTQSGNDRVRLSGTYHPETAGDTEEGRRILGLAFAQQWLGLASEADAVPVVSEAAPQLSGMYRVRSTSIDWAKGITQAQGTVFYSGELERVDGGFNAPVSEVQYAAGVRSEAEYTVTQQGSLWIPSTRNHQSVNVEPIARTTIDPDLTMVNIGAGTSAVVGSFQFGQDAATFYDGACTVETRYRVGATVGDWVPVVGRQIQQTAAADLRISNGVVRQTYATDATSGNGTVAFERAIIVGAVTSWATIVETEVSYDRPFTTTITDGPSGTPTIVRNSPESVIIKYQMGSDDSQSATATCTLNRGDSFVAWSNQGGVSLTVDAAYSGMPLGTSTTGYTTISGSLVSGYGYTFMTPIAMLVSPLRTAIISPTGTDVMAWAIGVYTATVGTGDREEVADSDDIARMYWLAIAMTQRLVTI